VRYSRHFKHLIDELGQPQFNNHQFKRMMNIVAVERCISVLHKIKKSNQSTPEFYKYDQILYGEQKLLTELTANQDPDILLKEMYRMSNS
jgi:phage-related protein